jgi:hypothetical protein
VGTPFWTPALLDLLDPSALPVVAAAAAAPTAHAASLLCGLALLHLDRQGRQRVTIDAAGVLLDVGPAWSGTRLEWARVRGFLLHEDGVRLVIAGRRLSRWLGPLVPARDRDAHELTLVLEQRGIPRL